MKTRISTIGEHTRAALLEDWGPKSLSLLVAIGLWVWVQSGLIVDEKIRAEVRYVWPADLVRLEDPPPVINLTVQGPQALVRRLQRERLVMNVDLAEAGEGAVNVDYTSIQVQGLPEGVEVMHHSPPSVDVNFERPMTRRVPVRIALAGDLAAGYKAGSAKANPSVVEITGPRSLVRALSDAPTEPIDLSELKAPRTLTVPLNLPSRSLSAAEHSSVQISINVEAIQGEKVLSEAIVEVSGRGYLVTPPTLKLTLTGPVAELERLKPSDVRVIAHLPDPAPASGRINIGGQGTDPRKIEVKLPASTNVVVKRIEPATVTVERAPN